MLEWWFASSLSPAKELMIIFARSWKAEAEEQIFQVFYKQVLENLSNLDHLSI